MRIRIVALSTVSPLSIGELVSMSDDSKIKKKYSKISYIIDYSEIHTDLSVNTSRISKILLLAMTLLVNRLARDSILKI